MERREELITADMPRKFRNLQSTQESVAISMRDFQFGDKDWEKAPSMMRESTRRSGAAQRKKDWRNGILELVYGGGRTEGRKR